MSSATTHHEINKAKANMDHIYSAPDPRTYFRELQKVDYAIPDLARPIFAGLADHLADRKGAPIQMLDLGCSYGVNAALLKYDLAMDDLYARWTDEAIADADSNDVIAADRRYFDRLEIANSIEMVGLDPSEPAVRYGAEAGLLDHGLAINLEADPLPDAAADALAPVDLVISTGCVGYVTDKTFDRLMPAVTRGRAPWLANFVLRMFPFDAIEQALTRRGYVTEKLAAHVFAQRSFVSDDEQAAVIVQLDTLGIDPAGKESEGDLFAELYLSRPADDGEMSVAELVSA